MFLLLILVSTTIGFVEGIPLVQKKSWKELTTLISLLVIALFLVIIKILNIPTPLQIVENLLYPFGRAIFRKF